MQLPHEYTMPGAWIEPVNLALFPLEGVTSGELRIYTDASASHNSSS